MEPSGIVDNDRAPAPRFIVVDMRVPEAIRRLIEEADGCLNMAFTVGGSACARRAIREMLVVEGIATEDYSEGLRALGEKHPAVPGALFQILELLGQGDQTHQVDALKALIATVKALAYEIYVLGLERVENLAYLRELIQVVDRDSAKSRTPARSRIPSKNN